MGQSFFETFTPQGQTEPNRWTHYIGSPEGVAGVLTEDALPPAQGLTSNYSQTHTYWAKDHLGSMVAQYQEGATDIQCYSFDTWGKRRNLNGTALVTTAGGALAMPGNLSNAQTQRGYTGHEMLDEVGLVHMNGRIYDPMIGRFTQADPVIQDPYLSQSYNRYSYVLNNPLSYTDPSGFTWWTKWRRPIFAAIVAVMAWYYAPQAIAAAAAAEAEAAGALEFVSATAASNGTGIAVLGLNSAGMAAVGAAGGFAAGGISSGNLEGAIVGAFQGFASAAVGNIFGAHGGVCHLTNAQAAGHIASHAAVGCASASMAGGSCRAGAMAQGFSALAGYIPGMDKAGLPGRMIVGGVASKLGGGEFASGALSAAFEYLYNSEGMSADGVWSWKNFFSGFGSYAKTKSIAAAENAVDYAIENPGTVVLAVATVTPAGRAAEIPVMLGLRAFGLETTAASAGARTLLSDPNWKQSVSALAANPQTRIMVSLDGMAGATTTEKVMNAVHQGAAKGATPTN